MASRLETLLEQAVRAGFAVTQAWSWKPGKDEFIPDVLVHPDTDDEVRFTGMPLVVCEVLSTNRSDDLVL